MAKQKAEKRKPAPVAAMLALIIPGVGHVYIGRTTRGIIIFLTIAATFWAGMALGGATTVDMRLERWWFVAGMFTGVHGVVAWFISEGVYDEVHRELADNNKLNRHLSAMARTYRQRFGVAAPASELQAVRRPFVDDRLAAKGVALVAPADIVARVYVGVAGLLNLLCIFDAMILSMMGKAREPARAAPKQDSHPQAPHAPADGKKPSGAQGEAKPT